MKIPAFIQPFLRRLQLATWPRERRLALLRVLYEIYRADGKMTEDEEAQLLEVAELLSLEPTDLRETDLESATESLREDRRATELACVYIASAVFADDDYDPAEKETVEKLVTTYGLPRESLERRIREAQERELDEVLEGWIEDLDGDAAST